MSKLMKNNFKLIFFFIVLTISLNCNKNHKQTMLISKELVASWKFKKQSDKKWYPAEIPGVVHTDLLRNNLIPPPFYGTNEHEIQWIENEIWEYQTEFSLDDDIFSKNHIEINFKGLDTYAEVRLNDSLILCADNMFRSWTIDCKNLLKKSGNKLNIIFLSPLNVNKSKIDSLPYILPAGNDRHDSKISVFTRKAPYHFGWDWGARFVTAGIWKSIEIIAWNIAKITDFQLYLLSLSEKKATINTIIEIKSETEKIILVQLFNDDNLLKEKEFRLQKGKNIIKQELQIQNPKLWWTNGLGEAYLYNFSVKILDKGALIEQKTTRFGIRTIEIVEKLDSIGKSFYIKLNGVPVFIKGANYIPQDNFLPRVSKEQYERLIFAAKDINMNMLRVWGGGIYENDEFYDLCDENGILVWQDFMFSCSMYPADSTFLSNIEHEAIENVKRLRNHPCLALWCGNNEMQVAWERWGYQQTYGYSKIDSAEIYNDYLKIFHDLLPNIINTIDKGRFYLPSSPNSAPSGWEEESQTGDFHYWGVWWGHEPFSAYEKFVGRFMSEYGFQSFPSYSTIEKFSQDSSCYLISSVMKSHNKHYSGFEIINEYLRRNFNIPKNFKDYVIVSQLLQAEGMKIAIESHRRAMPYCMGTLYWQLNDCWPAISWSSIDYFGNWKAFHYYLRKLYAPVLVSPVYKNKKLSVYLISDYLDNRNVKLKMTLMDFYGKELWNNEEQVIMPANTSTIIFSQEFHAILQKYDKQKIFLHVEITQNNYLLAENNLFFERTKNLILPKSNIKFKIVKNKGKIGVEISSVVFVKNIFIDYPNDKGNFSDNYFALMPKEKIIIWINLPKAEKEFTEKIKIKSVE